MQRMYLRGRTPFVAAGLALLLAIAWWSYPGVFVKEYRTFPSPDGRYSVVLVRIPRWWGVFPGQAGDAPGRVRLYDAEGRLLQEANVEMVQLVDDVTWEANRVHIKMVADWELPE